MAMTRGTRKVMSEWAKVVQELGLGAALAIGMFIAFFFLLKWVLETSKDMLGQMAKERETWTICLKNLNDQYINMSVNNKAFYDQVDTAHKFQREEHREMTQILGRINGFKHQGGN
jgi:hypothetical protein